MLLQMSDSCWIPAEILLSSSSVAAQAFLEKELCNMVMFDGSDPKLHFQDLEFIHQKLVIAGRYLRQGLCYSLSCLSAGILQQFLSIDGVGIYNVV